MSRVDLAQAGDTTLEATDGTMRQRWLITPPCQLDGVDGDARRESMEKSVHLRGVVEKGCSVVTEQEVCCSE